MKIRSMLATATAGLLMMLGLGMGLATNAAAATGPGSWKAQTVPTVPATTDFKGVYFLDATHGWVVGGQDNFATALYTTDGGVTWKNATINGENISGKMRVAHFIDLNNGFAVTDLGSIYKSVDGGISWDLVANTPANVKFEDIHFGSSKIGCAVGFQTNRSPDKSSIVCTKDGGATWVELADNKVPDIANIEGISFATAGTAYAVGDRGIIKTTNADATLLTDVTWTQLAAATAAPASGSTRHYADIHCIDTTHCTLVGEDSPDTGASVPFVASSSDGTTFGIRPNCTTAGLEAVSFPPGDLQNGWIVGGPEDQTAVTPGDVCHTANGGASAWANQASPAQHEYMDVWMVDACHGWAVTEGASIQAWTCSILPSPSPTATVAPALPKAGYNPGGGGEWPLVALVLLLTGGGAAALRRGLRA